MLTLALLPKTDGIILPNMPKGKNKDEYGLCYLKAVENAGRRDIKVDNYIARTTSKNKLKQKDLGIDESPFTGVPRKKGTLTWDYASYLTASNSDKADMATDALLDMEQADLLKEFVEESQQIALQSDVWLFTLLENLIKTAGETRSTKKRKLLAKVAELGVEALISDVIRAGLYPTLREMYSGVELASIELETEGIEVEALAI